MKYLLILVYPIILFTRLIADPLDGYWQQKVDYEMDITLIDSAQQLTGFSKIRYTNNSPDSLDRIYMHLYPNAFQLNSVKYREYIGNAGRASRAKYFKDRLDGFTSKIEIHDFNIAQKKKPILKGYSIDDTILKAILLQKLAPNESIRIDIRWTHHIGEMVERAGYYRGQYNMAQWYPKLVVYDQDGWHANVFHAEGEFYGEFGDFNVKFDLPKTFIIAASGIVTNGDPGWESVTVDTSLDYDIWIDIFDSTYVEPDSTERRNVTFLAENVHDFAWVASRNFLYEGGKYEDIDVHVLYDKDRGDKWTKVVLERSINAMAWLEEKFGEYPYPQVTTTDRMKPGGMEYPMLVMNGRDDEGLIVHEYGHIYFYGILANDEVDEAWLDEGFTTTQTTHYLMERYGNQGFDLSLYDDYEKFPKKYWPLENDLHSDQWRVIRFMRSGHDENISRPSHLFNNGFAYGRNAYTKPALMLTELKYFLGDSVYYAALQHYYNKWKLKHVNEERFVEAVEEFTGQELDWFFDAWLHTTHHLDYGIKSFNKSQNKNGSWTIELGIDCIGKRFIPLLVETTFKDGTKDRRWWENHLWRYEDTFIYTVDKKPVKVTIDPDVQTVDLDYRNNTTAMKRKILFDWPGLWYNPRDEYVIRWIPNFYYQEKTIGLAPGITLDYDYGQYEGTTIRANYGLESKELFWYIGGWREPVHYFPRTTFHFWAFNRPGVKEIGGEIEKKWNRAYGRTPTHNFSLGFYVQPQYNFTYAKKLGYNSDGKLGVGYIDWSSKIGSFSFSINGASSLGNLSDWNFTRMTTTAYFSQSFKKFSFNNRFIMGKIWAGSSGVPGQEGYNIEGNSSSDLLRKNYLVDQFYGIEIFDGDSLISHYHMPGEGNIRGFVSENRRGADALIAQSSELSISQSFYKINFQFTIFGDVGIFWDKNRAIWRPIDNPSKYFERVLGDLGLGTRIKTKLFEKDLFLRVDLPFFIYDDGVIRIEKNNWIFSFQRSL
ncbi:MAG: hypothetical protein CMG57_00305 [Candidatus Marinimicrobia bacterium]|nr:hypothetical protein [Candidatus Neomarinimicrobiota bacterium]